MNNPPTPKILINLFLKYTFFPAISSPLSNSPASKFPDIISQIEENINKNINKKKIDSEKDADDIKNNTIYKRTIVQKYIRLRY